MNDSTHDVAVLGLGGMGSAALAELARRGIDVVGIDRWRPPHDLGSSHGQSRIFRVAYFEHPDYVPLARRAGDLWRELDQRHRERVFIETGGAWIGRGQWSCPVRCVRPSNTDWNTSFSTRTRCEDAGPP